MRRAWAIEAPGILSSTRLDVRPHRLVLSNCCVAPPVDSTTSRPRSLTPRSAGYSRKERKTRERGGPKGCPWLRVSQPTINVTTSKRRIAFIPLYLTPSANADRSDRGTRVLITPFGAGLYDSISRRRDNQLHIASGGHDPLKHAACSSRICVTQFTFLRPSRQYVLDRTNAVDPGWRGPEHV